MATVELSFTPLPAHVRTARLVATAVARRSRVEESLLDEVRLAVGEACSRAVEAHRLHCPAEPVRIELSDRNGRFEVVVTDTAPGGADDRAAAEPGDAAARHAGGLAAGLTGDAADTAGTGVHEGGAGGAAPPGPAGFPVPGSAVPGTGSSGAAAPTTESPGGTAAPGSAADTGSAPTGGPVAGDTADGTINGSLPADIGLAVIEGLADDVQICATARGVTIRMSWPVPES